MENKNIIRARRALLFSTRMRFSPETQPIKEEAIDKILEQIILTVSDDSGLSVKEIEKSRKLEFAGGTPAITRSEIENSIKRLLASKRILRIGEKHKKRYVLSKSNANNLMEIQRNSESRIKNIVASVFSVDEKHVNIYSDAFLECLCHIFSKLGSTYVKLMTGKAQALV